MDHLLHLIAPLVLIPQAAALQAYNGDRAALAATILARQLEAQQPVGPAQPIKALLEQASPQLDSDRGRHDKGADSPLPAAAAEAAASLPSELSTEVVWRPACEHDPELSQVAIVEDHQSLPEKRDGQPQLQVEYGRWLDQQRESAAQQQQRGSASSQLADLDSGQVLSSETSVHLPEYTQAESEFHNTKATISSAHDMPMKDHHSCSRQSSPDRTQHLSDEAHRQPLPITHTHNSARFSKDDQHHDIQLEYLQNLHHPPQSRGHPSAGSRPESSYSHQAKHLGVIHPPAAEAVRVLSPEHLASTAGRSALDQSPTGSADQKHDRPQRVGTQASEVPFHGQQMGDSSHAASMKTSERLESDMHAQDCPTGLHARDPSFQALVARAGPTMVSHYPADPEAPSPDRDGLLLDGAPHSPDRKQPMLGGAPHSPDREQPMLRGAPHSPDREQPSLAAAPPGRSSDAGASAGNNTAEGRTHSGPKAPQQAARALKEGLSHATAIAQCMSTDVHARPGS